MTLNYKELSEEQVDYLAVAEEGELTNGERISFAIEEYQIVVFNIAGQLFAIGDICSHDGQSLDDGELIEDEVICPRHGAHFSVKDGSVKSLPAVEDIPAYPVKIEDGQVLIGLPKQL